MNIVILGKTIFMGNQLSLSNISPFHWELKDFFPIQPFQKHSVFSS